VPVLRSPPTQRLTRPFVGLFLATIVVCAVAAWNLWPFSNWELFSRLRANRQTGWEALVVIGRSRERAYPIASLPDGYRGFASVMADLARRSVAQRDADCAVWLRDASERFGPATRVVRIYRVEWFILNRRVDRDAPPHLTLAWICSAKGPREA
jgi:hypothetical protein